MGPDIVSRLPGRKRKVSLDTQLLGRIVIGVPAKRR